jgi:hypothetical protein
VQISSTKIAKMRWSFPPILKAPHLDLLLIFVSSLSVALLVGPELPRRFSADAEVIARRFGSGSFRPFGSTFTNTAWAYAAFGIGPQTPLPVVSLFNLSWAWLASVLAVADLRSKLHSVRVAASIAVGVPLGAFLFPLTKEFTALVLLACLFLAWRLFRPRLAIVVGLLAIAVYAAFMREYWALAGFLTLFFLLLLKSRLKMGAMLIVALPTLAILYSVAVSLLGRPFAAVRLEFNEVGDRASTTDSIITNFIFSSNPLLDLVNSTLIWLESLFPISMLLSFDSIQVSFGLFQVVLTIVLIHVFVTVWRTRRWRSAAAREGRFLLSFVIAFTMVQALFEPDFGSVVRHRAFLFLIVLRLWILQGMILVELKRARTRVVGVAGQGARAS